MIRSAAFALSLLVLVGCGSLPRTERVRLAAAAVDARDVALDCSEPDACALPSPWRAAADGVAHSTPPRHQVTLLERGSDALAIRLHLIEAAQSSIELQSFIFELDDSGELVLDALLRAARRGVQVRVLLDQLYGLNEPNLQAALGGFHRNFELRLYNPTFDEARTQALEFAAGIVCCFRRFNQRMHTKLLLVDGRIGISGGRNVQNRYFDWDPAYNYRDRDVLVAGPVTRRMAQEFEAFWNTERSVPAERLADVARRWQKHDGPPPGALAWRQAGWDGRQQAMLALARDGAELRSRLAADTFNVGDVLYIADLPEKHTDAVSRAAGASQDMRDLLTAAQHDVLLQTPYLVMSPPARQVFRDLQRRPQPPTVRVSTNSLAATDAFPVYAMSHKYKRTYLHEFRFQIHEYKPYPTNTPIDPAATGALGAQAAARFPMFGSGSRGSASGPVPLRRAGVRVGLHAKSVVIDGEVAVVGTHNFDPRSDHWNTEAMVVLRDRSFAAALSAAIERDMAPDNSWRIARREKPPVLSGLSYTLGRWSEALPIFDLWPFPFASSFELQAGCAPVPPGDADFYRCWRDVGAFPEVDVGSKRIYTRILTGFGAGLKPIL